MKHLLLSIVFLRLPRLLIHGKHLQVKFIFVLIQSYPRLKLRQCHLNNKMRWFLLNHGGISIFKSAESRFIARKIWTAQDPIWAREVIYYNLWVSNLKEILNRIVIHHANSSLNIQSLDRFKFRNKYEWTVRHSVMNKFIVLLVLSFLLLSFSACQKITPQSEMGIELLSLPVATRKNEDIKKFNTILEMASKNKQDWVDEPVLIINRFLNLSAGDETLLSFNGEGENPGQYEIVVINNNIKDDSIKGERYDIVIIRDRNDIWQIKSATVSWLCWEDRGHSDYSVTLCS